MEYGKAKLLKFHKSDLETQTPHYYVMPERKAPAYFVIVPPRERRRIQGACTAGAAGESDQRHGHEL